MPILSSSYQDISKVLSQFGWIVILCLWLPGVPLNAAQPTHEIIKTSQPKTFQPDNAELADTFFTSLGKDSPQLLEKYMKIRTILADTGALARIGGYLSGGDYSDAYSEIKKLVGDKMIDAIPIFGTMEKLGADLGHLATDNFGKGRFDGLYTTAQKRLDAGDWEQGFDSGFVQALITEGTKGGNIYTWLNEKTGVERSRSENEKLLWKILKAKHNFNILCDKYHLKGEDRSYDILMIYLNADIRSSAKQAVRREKMKAEDRAFFKKRKEENRAERLRILAEQDKKRCDIWLGRVRDPNSASSYEDRPSDGIILQQCGEKPKPSKTTDSNMTVTVDDTATDISDISAADNNITVSSDIQDTNATVSVITFAPREPKINVHGGISVSILRRVVGDATYCTARIVNNTQKPMPDLSLSVEATEPYDSGGTGGGGTVSLRPGEIHSFTISSFGEAKGAKGALSLGNRSLGSFTCFSAHKVKKNISFLPNHTVNGTYTGSITGNIAKGGITIVITGNKITGEIGGRFEAMGDSGSIGAEISGSFDPKSGVLVGSFEGSAINEKDGKAEGIGGSLKGVLTGTMLSGSWQGSANLASDEGKWNASQ